MQAQLAAGQQGGADIGFPQFLEMFRSDLLDLREILEYLQLGSTAPDGLAELPQVCSEWSLQVVACREPLREERMELLWDGCMLMWAPQDSVLDSGQIRV